MRTKPTRDVASVSRSQRAGFQSSGAKFGWFPRAGRNLRAAWSIRAGMYTDPMLTALWLLALAGLPLEPWALEMMARWMDDERLWS